MPSKTGMSHGLAAFATLIIGSVYSELVWTLLPPVGELSLAVIRVFRTTLGVTLPLNKQFAGTVVLMVVLATLWGTIYHFGRYS